MPNFYSLNHCSCIFLFGQNVRHFRKSSGRQNQNFAKFNNTKYAVSVSSGTTALHLAVACLNLPRGSEVIVSSTTNIATVLAITHNNLTPIFIDSKIDTWNIDENIIEKRITKF